MLRRAAAAAATLLRVRCVLFFFDDRTAIPAAAEAVELSKAELQRLISEHAASWGGELGQPDWFDEGGRLFALQRHDGELVSFGWAKRGRAFHVGEIGRVVELRSETWWIWSCFTPAEYRGMGYYPALLVGIRARLHYAPAVIYCLRENIASRRGIEKAGFVPAFSIRRHRLFTVCRQSKRGLLAGVRRA